MTNELVFEKKLRVGGFASQMTVAELEARAEPELFFTLQGYGKALLRELARIAVECGCGRLEWWCLDWNQPSVDFYLFL